MTFLFIFIFSANLCIYLSFNSSSSLTPCVRIDVWLKGLVERRGKKCAAVALANKTVRTAYAMLC